MYRVTRGEREYEALIGSAPGIAQEQLRRRSPWMYDAMVEGAFGGTLARAELSRADREKATIAILAAAGGAERQLNTHVTAALRAGVAPAELRALAEHITVYAGFPRGLNALTIIDEILTDAGVPQPPVLHRVALADHETVVAQRGDSGPAVVLIHALGLEWQMWDEVMTALSAGRRVFAYDIRGHGAASGSPNPFTMADTARDLIGVMDHLGLESAHVVGLSYGGGIAQTAAVAHPDRFASLSLLGTTDHAFPSFESRARSGEVDGMDAQIVPSLTRWFTPDALAVNGPTVRYAREQVRRTYTEDWAGAWRAFLDIDVQDRLADFPAPVLVLAGELDASCTPEIMTGIAKRIPGSTYRELPGVPHMMTLESPTEVTQALDEFLTAQS